jgi:hypothetical protein
VKVEEGNSVVVVVDAAAVDVVADDAVDAAVDVADDDEVPVEVDVSNSRRVAVNLVVHS